MFVLGDYDFSMTRYEWNDLLRRDRVTESIDASSSSDCIR